MKNLFAARIRELRREAGLSQEQLAAKYGLSVQAVSKWECAQSYPDIELLVELAEQFGVTPNNLDQIVYRINGKLHKFGPALHRKHTRRLFNTAA